MFKGISLKITINILKFSVEFWIVHKEGGSHYYTIEARKGKKLHHKYGMVPF